jgi:hypothetical protein
MEEKEVMANAKNIENKTGRTLENWFSLLEDRGCAVLPHKAIADYLHGEHGVDYWWAQTLTVEFERHIGRRVKGQTSDGLFQLGIRRTLAVPLSELWILITERGELWQDKDGPAGEDRYSTFKEGSHFRMAWTDGSWKSHSILQIRILPGKKDRNSVLSIHQEKIPDIQSRERLKEHWSGVLGQVEEMIG